MPLVKLLRGGLLTLPAATRRRLRLNEGDYLEAEEVAGGVMLKPVAVVGRERAWDDLIALVNEPKGVDPALSDDDLLEMADDEIHAMRAGHG